LQTATTDTLTVAAGSGISLTTNASTDTLTITATGSGLSANAVTSAYLASNAVLARHIATDAVGSSELVATGVSAGTYGSSTASPQFTVDTDGRITSVGNVTISSSGGGGSAGLNQVINTYESTGDGSTVAFNTGTTITSEDLTWVFIDGVYQEKGAYSTSGSTVTFSAAPPNGTSIEVLNLSSITTGGAFDHNSFSGDGSTTDFTLANTPDSETDLIVFIDGVYQNNNAFNVSGTTLSFDTAPANGTTVIAYSIGGVVTGKANLVNTFNGDSSTTDFTLSIDPKDEKNTIVFVGGVYQPKATYSISGTTLTFSEAPPTGTGNIEVSISQITTTTQLAADILDGNTFTGDTELTGELTAGEFIGNLRGATLFKGQAGEALSKGDVVYISGISGNTTVVSKADADDATKMPAFGIVAEDASNNAPATVYTFGSLTGLDTSSFSEGDELFVSTTAGTLTDTPPTGESSALQKIAKVTRSDNAASGTIFIMGAGRSNAVPNLDDGDIFIGNASNQAVTSALSTEVESYLDGGTSTPSFASLNVTTTTTDDSVTITTTEDSSLAAPVVTLKRNSSSPADADYLGQIKFKGENDGDQEVVYAKITGKIGDNTDTTEDGTIEFANVKDGLETITVRLKSDEMQLINSTGLNVGGTSVLSGLTYPTSDGSAGQYLQTDGSGNLSFSTVSTYTDSDVETYLNTSEIYTDSTNNRLGIGTNNPSSPLEVVSGASHGMRLSNTDGYLEIGTNNQVMNLDSQTHTFRNEAGSSEYMRIDSSGNVLVGKTATGLANAGIELTASNILRTTKANSASAEFNRTGTNGDIAIFWKDTSPVGNIGVVNDDRMYFATYDGLGLQFDKDNNRIVPCDAAGAYNNNVELGDSSLEFTNLWLSGGVRGTSNIDITVPETAGAAIKLEFGNNVNDTRRTVQAYKDNFEPVAADTGVISLGQATNKWKDLYLSSGVVFDAVAGNATSNTLDDYEEGTWTVSEVNGQGGTMTTNRAHYTKIGRMVFASASVTVGTTTNTNVLNLSLPFASSINGYYLGGGNVSYHNLPTARSDNIRANVENAAADVHFLYGDNSNPNLKLKCSEASTKRIDFFVQYQV
jgi:hypothetical protein